MSRACDRLSCPDNVSGKAPAQRAAHMEPYVNEEFAPLSALLQHGWCCLGVVGGFGASSCGRGGTRREARNWPSNGALRAILSQTTTNSRSRFRADLRFNHQASGFGRGPSPLWNRAATMGLQCPSVQKMLPTSCAYGNERRSRCAFQPVPMRCAPLNQGLPAEEFVELTPEPAEASVHSAPPSTRMAHSTKPSVSRGLICSAVEGGRAESQGFISRAQPL